MYDTGITYKFDLIYMAAIVGTALMLPQIIHTIKTKSACDLSFIMLWLYLLNCLLWLIYGSLLLALPMILCNTVCLMLSIIMLRLKFKYNRVEYVH